MKPIKFREIARKFVGTYYPQFFTRFDRIWDMLNELDFRKQLVATTPQYQIGDGLAFAGEADPKLKEMVKGEAVFVFASQKLKLEVNISEMELADCFNTICLSMKVSPDMKEKILSIVNNVSIVNDALTAESLEKEEDIYVVYTSNPDGMGTDRNLVSEKELKTRYFTNKETFDIFIYHRVVEKKVRIVNSNQEKEIITQVHLDGIILNLLILFLKYKDIHLPYVKLYHKAWDRSPHHDERYKVPGDVIDILKSSVSKLRNPFRGIKNFIIPRASMSGYTCNGNFKFCLILRKTIDRLYTLEGV